MVNNLNPCIWYLHKAARYGNPSEAHLCLNNGSDINQPSPKGFTPLIISVKMGHFLLSRLLAKAGACIHIKNKHGNTPHGAYFTADLSNRISDINATMKHHHNEVLKVLKYYANK